MTASGTSRSAPHRGRPDRSSTGRASSRPTGDPRVSSDARSRDSSRPAALPRQPSACIDSTPAGRRSRSAASRRSPRAIDRAGRRARRVAADLPAAVDRRHFLERREPEARQQEIAKREPNANAAHLALEILPGASPVDDVTRRVGAPTPRWQPARTRPCPWACTQASASRAHPIQIARANPRSSSSDASSTQVFSAGVMSPVVSASRRRSR